ncbi:hypothetical protein [Acidianus sp. HS-5]|uniref:hypothetical protein n=1 Tax=Acidianus sp. HS-5 TaxID=2886040 RepID=UPI001F20548C|nr:hypothetical protein [Acidianus sp. HS-5]BDC17831.1 hypothetical protein HS5_07210 [Acidianus sp. HS-5]
MNGFVLFFFIPLSWFVTVFMIEAGSVVMTPVCRYENYREKMLITIGSLWAIIGTSLVYLVVSLDTIFAPVMFVTGAVLYAPLMVLIIMLAFHHFSIGVAEGSSTLGKHSMEKAFLVVALPFALIVAFLGNTLFTSVFSGYGFCVHNLLTLDITPNYTQMLFNALNWVFFIGVVMYVVYFTVVFYGIKERLLIGALGLTLANILFLVSAYEWLPVVFNSAIGNAGFWIYLILLYAYLYIATTKNVPFRQAWIFLLTFIGALMFGAFTQGRILQDIVPKGTIGPLPGVPASLLLTNPATLTAGSIVLGMAGLLVLGGITAVSYKVLYKVATERVESKKVTTK